MLKSAHEEAQGVVGDVRAEWKRLWRERIDDRFRAEGLANQDFSLLFVERGTVIVATRDFKLLDLKEILRLHEVEDAERFIPSLLDALVSDRGRISPIFLLVHRTSAKK